MKEATVSLPLRYAKESDPSKCKGEDMFRLRAYFIECRTWKIFFHQIKVGRRRRFQTYNDMKCFLTALLFSAASALFAQVDTPDFVITEYTIAIPTNTPGFELDSKASLHGDKIIYQFNGQAFINEPWRIPLAEKLIVGTTRRATPWQTLAELLSAYQHSPTSNNVAVLYDKTASKHFLESVFGDKEAESRFSEFGSSITNMSALFCLKTTDTDYAVVTTIQTTDSDIPEPLPFFMKKTAGPDGSPIFLLSAREPMSPMEANLIVYIDSLTVTNLQKK